MKNSILILSILLISLSFDAFGQKPHFHNHTNFSHNHHINFSTGLIANIFLNEFFGSYKNHRKMTFVYNHNKQTWRLKKDVSTNNNLLCNNHTITARFENPNGGRDFFVKVNRWGEWFIDCPKRFKKILKNKVRKNI